VSCRWNAWCWFPPFTRPGVPGQPHSAVRACAHDESERGRIESDGGGAETRKGYGERDEELVDMEKGCTVPFKVRAQVRWPTEL